MALFNLTLKHFCGIGLVVLLLAACQNQPEEVLAQQETAPAATQETEQSNSEESLATVDETAVQEVQVPAQPAAPVWQYDVSELLAEADAALAADRLMTPIEDNAFDRYHAVLILQPGNEAALQGLHALFNRYVFLTRDAILTGEYGKARALIERARAVDSGSELLALLEAEVSEKQRERARNQPQVVLDPNQKEIELSIAGLNRRDDAMVEVLQTLAMQVREADETLLIVARSDSEGRWIYQRMAEGVPGYRLRGDIRLGRVPKVLFLPPIE